jgi:hypothetical protein
LLSSVSPEQSLVAQGEGKEFAELISGSINGDGEGDGEEDFEGDTDSYIDGGGMCMGRGLDGMLWSIQELLLLIVSDINMLVSKGWLLGNTRLRTNSLCLMK